MNLNRLISLIGKDNVSKLSKLNILLIGLGGVGGYTLESLVRSGVGKFTLVDGDTIEPSNINRQIISHRFNNNMYKTKVAYRRVKLINKNCNITLINKMIKVEDMNLLFMQKYDYIIDACDSVLVKQELIRECFKRNIKIISCMGTAKRIDATKLKIDTLNEVIDDPLAKKVKKDLTIEEKEYTITIHSTEKAADIKELGSTSYVPGVAGLLITNYIVNDVIKNKN